MSEYVKIHLRDDKSVVVLVRLKNLLDRLPSSFMRIHRSYIINLNAIVEVNKTVSSSRGMSSCPLVTAIGTLSTNTSAIGLYSKPALGFGRYPDGSLPMLRSPSYRKRSIGPLQPALLLWHCRIRGNQRPLFARSTPALRLFA